MSSILKIIKLSKPQHKWIILACALITVQALLQQGIPVTLKFVVDELGRQIQDGTGNIQRLTFLFGLLLAIHVGGVFISTINSAWATLSARASGDT